MTDDTTTGRDALDEGALLAAYLDGDTDEVTTARIERRLADDDALARRLDALATTRARLQRLDQVTAPSDVRDRLRARLDQGRARAAGMRGAQAAEAPAAGTRAARPRSRLVPVLTVAAAVAAVALLGSAAVLGQLGMGGANESAGEAALEARGGATAEEPQATVPDSGAAGGAESGDAPAAAADDAVSEAAAPAEVEGDQDIAARAARLRASPPDDLRARERALREGADLSTERLCVGEVEAATVDLVDEDGRVALAVSVRDDSRQIVLLDPRTCAAIRTISTQR